MMKQVWSITQAGPTHDDLEPFEFTQEFDRRTDCPHMGMPIKYDFDWVTMKSKF